MPSIRMELWLEVNLVNWCYGVIVEDGYGLSSSFTFAFIGDKCILISVLNLFAIAVLMGFVYGWTFIQLNKLNRRAHVIC